MNYEMSKLSGPENTSPYITYGSNQELKINNIELKFSKNTGSPKAILHVETPPVVKEGFVPVEGFKGRVGKVACGVYMKDDFAKKQFLRKMLNIAAAMGIEEEVNKINDNSFETIVNKIAKVFSNHGRFARFTVFGEEYAKVNNKIGITLYFPRTNFVENLDANPSTLVQFDKNDPWHYKKLPAQTTESFHDETTGAEDLPF